MKIEITNDAIVYNDGIQSYPCTYTNVLNEQFPMVIESKKSLLQDIDLNDMLINLNNSAELLYIAFCALHGKSIQAQLDGLQASLLKLCGKTKTTMTVFRDQSKQITLETLKSYSWMKKGFTNQALIIFNSSAQYAQSMAESSKQLSEEFEKLADQTTNVLKEVEKEHATEIENKQMIEDELKKMKAENEKHLKLASELKNDLEVINAEYQDEKQKLESAEKREMITSIVSAFTGALTLGIEAAVSSSTHKPSQDHSAEIAQHNQRIQENQNQQTQLTNQKQESERRLSELKNDLIELQNTFENKNELLQNKQNLLSQETVEELKKSLENDISEIKLEIKNIENKISMKQEDIKRVEKSLKDYTTQLAGLAAALKSITESLKSMEEKSHSAVENHSQKVNSLLEKKLQMEEEKRESLAEIEKFALLIKDSKDKVITTDKAIQMLLVAIRCLKKVSASLLVAAMFWDSLKKYCESLASATIKELIASVASLSKDERIDFFTDPDFVFELLNYASKWAAMYYLSDEYYVAANDTFAYSQKNFESMPDSEHAMQIAQERSTLILSNIASQTRNANLEILNIQKKQEELSQGDNKHE